MTRSETPKISWKLRHTLKGHTEEITSVAFHPTEMVIISASADGTLRFWNAESGEPTDVVEDWDGGSHCMAMSPNGAMVAFGGQIEGPTILALSRGRAGDRTTVSDDTYVLSVAFSPDGSTLAWGQGSGGKIGFYNLQTQQLTQWHHGGDNAVSALAYSPKDTYLASGSKNGSLRLWNVATGEPHLHLAGHDAAIGTVAFSPDGTILATGGSDKKLRLWDVNSGALLNEIGDNPVLAVCFSPALPVYAYGGHEEHSAITIRHTGSSEVLATLTGHGGTIRDLAFSPDGKLLASGCHDKTVRIWEITVEE